jgi:hypothetical protein
MSQALLNWSDGRRSTTWHARAMQAHAVGVVSLVALLGCNSRTNQTAEQARPTAAVSQVGSPPTRDPALDQPDARYALNFTPGPRGIAECFGAAVALGTQGDEHPRRDHATAAAKALILEIAAAAHRVPPSTVSVEDTSKYVVDVAAGAPMRTAFPHDGATVADQLVISTSVCRYADTSPVDTCRLSGRSGELRWELEWVDLDGTTVTESRCRILGGTWSRARQ